MTEKLLKTVTVSFEDSKKFYFSLVNEEKEFVDGLLILLQHEKINVDGLQVTFHSFCQKIIK
jgi:hypothetical protein